MGVTGNVLYVYVQQVRPMSMKIRLLQSEFNSDGSLALAVWNRDVLEVLVSIEQSPVRLHAAVH